MQLDHWVTQPHLWGTGEAPSGAELASPIEQCREEAGLHSQKDVEEMK